MALGPEVLGSSTVLARDPDAFMNVQTSDYELDLPEVPVSEVVVQLTPAHRAGRKCQNKIGQVAHQIHGNLALKREPTRGVLVPQVAEIHETAVEMHRRYAAYCNKHCYAAILGQCAFAQELEDAPTENPGLPVEQAVEFIAGEISDITVKKTQSTHTTSILETTGRVLSTGLLDRPTSVATIVMNGTRAEFQEHAAKTALGRKAGIGYQPTLM